VANAMITVLIFSYNRPYHLQRAIKYWGQFNYPVIIADGSNRPLLKPIPHNIEYLHRPGIGFLDRIREMSEKVETRYTVLTPDDDFIGFDGLQYIIDFLNKNPDYSSAQGLYTRYEKKESENYIYSHWDYSYASKYSHVDLSAENRILAAMSYPIMHYCYSVMKLGCLMRAMKILDGIDESLMSVSTFEISFIFALMSHGKYTTLPVFYMARERAMRQNDIAFDEWVDLNSTSGYAQWRSNIFHIFDKDCGLPFLQSTKIIDQSLGLILDGLRIKRINNISAAKNSNIKILKEKLRGALSTRSINTLRLLFFKLNFFRYLYRIFKTNLKAYILFFSDWSRIKSAIRS